MQKYVPFGTCCFAKMLTFSDVGTPVFVNVLQISDMLKCSVPNMQKYVPFGTCCFANILTFSDVCLFAVPNVR